MKPVIPPQNVSTEDKIKSVQSDIQILEMANYREDKLYLEIVGYQPEEEIDDLRKKALRRAKKKLAELTGNVIRHENPDAEKLREALGNLLAAMAPRFAKHPDFILEVNEAFQALDDTNPERKCPHCGQSMP